MSEGQDRDPCETVASLTGAPHGSPVDIPPLIAYPIDMAAVSWALRAEGRYLTGDEAYEIVRRCALVGGTEPAQPVAGAVDLADEVAGLREVVRMLTTPGFPCLFGRSHDRWSVCLEDGGRLFTGPGGTTDPAPVAALRYAGRPDLAAIVERALAQPSAPAAATVAPEAPGRPDVAPEPVRAVEGRQGAMDALAILVDRLTPWDGETLDEAQRVIERALDERSRPSPRRHPVADKLTDQEIAEGLALADAEEARDAECVAAEAANDVDAGAAAMNRWQIAFNRWDSWATGKRSMALVRELARLRTLERAVHHEAECLAEVRAETWRVAFEAVEVTGRHFEIVMHLKPKSRMDSLECYQEPMRPRAAVLAELLELQEAP